MVHELNSSNGEVDFVCIPVTEYRTLIDHATMLSVISGIAKQNRASYDKMDTIAEIIAVYETRFIVTMEADNA